MSTTARIPQPIPGEFSEEQRAYYAAISSSKYGQIATKEDGPMMGPPAVQIHVPDLALANWKSGEVFRAHRTLPVRATEIAILSMASKLKAGFVWTAHVTYGRAAGISEDEIESLRRREHLDLGDPVDRAVYEMTQALLERQDLSDEEYTRAASALTIRQLIEVTFLVGHYSQVGMQMKVFRVDQPFGVDPPAS